MILDEIVLHDFGIYGGRQVVALDPPSERKPVILFGGLNGGGKTTLLDAIQLCLFGPFAQCSNRGNLAYHDYLRRSIHRNAAAREAAIELAFRHRLDGEEQHYRLHRSWKVTDKGCRENFEVIRNGQLDTAASENWANQVHDFLPANIAHLFLFDGEKIEGYASEQHSARLVGSAIENLLGLDIVDQLDKDLDTLDRRKRLEKKTEDVQAEVKRIEEQLRLLRSRYDSLHQERGSVTTYRLERNEKALKEVDAQYRKLGGELYDQRKELEGRKHAADDKAEQGRTALRELAAGDLPLALVGELLRNMRARDDSEEAGRLARDLLGALEERDRNLMAEIRRLSKSKSLIEKIDKFQKSDRDTRRNLAQTQPELELSADARARAQALDEDGLNSAKREARKLLKRQKGLDADVEHAEIEYASIPAPDTLAAINEKRENLAKEIAAARSEIDSIDASLARLQRDIERHEQDLARFFEAEAQSGIEGEDRERILSHASKVRKTLETFRRAVVRKHVRRIESLVLESYQHLLRKTSLVAGLRIDPESFEIALFGRDGGQLETSRLSAGERQLLGVSLLWGLAKASGRPLPTAIDTPLGRLDTFHRSHLVERYFPFASHQVFLLSTDEEITDEYLTKLKPWIGRSYQLEFNDNTGSTEIVPGYFGERMVANVH